MEERTSLIGRSHVCDDTGKSLKHCLSWQGLFRSSVNLIGKIIVLYCDGYVFLGVTYDQI
jgi:hypothetical protein